VSGALSGALSSEGGPRPARRRLDLGEGLRVDTTRAVASRRPACSAAPWAGLYWASRGGEAAKVGEGAGALFLGEFDEVDEKLGRGGCVG
jgi:hypothetical protein